MSDNPFEYPLPILVPSGAKTLGDATVEDLDAMIAWREKRIEVAKQEMALLKEWEKVLETPREAAVLRKLEQFYRSNADDIVR